MFGAVELVRIEFFLKYIPHFKRFTCLMLTVGLQILTDLIASFEKSMFRNFPELRLRIVDIT